MKKLYKKLAEIRRERHISLHQLEKDINIPSQKLMDVENGKGELLVAELMSLLDYYNLSYDQVLHYRSKKRFRSKKRTWRIMAESISALLIMLSGTFIYTRFTVHHQNAQSVETRSVAINKIDTTNPPPPSQSNDSTPIIKTDSIKNKVDKVTFRFWGNMQYDSSNAPKIEDVQENKVIDIIPIEKLSDNFPTWLEEKDRNQLLLNVGTSDVRTSSTLEAFQKLSDQHFRVFGLGKTPDVYSPYILEVNSKKIGFLSLTGLIHEQNQIAVPSRIGLPSAYVEHEVIQYVKAAKEKVDYLFVLIDWGKTWENKHNLSQRKTAEAIIRGGADFIVGNHPFYSQDIEVIQGKPVFYALGEATSYYAKETSTNFVLEADFTEQVDDLRIRMGKLNHGGLEFNVIPDDEKHIEDTLSIPDELKDKLRLKN